MQSLSALRIIHCSVMKRFAQPQSRLCSYLGQVLGNQHADLTYMWTDWAKCRRGQTLTCLPFFNAIELSVSNTSTLSIFHGPVYGTRLVLIAKIYQDMSALIMQQIGHPPFSPCACDQRHYEMQNRPSYIRRFKGKLDTTIKDAEI